MAKKSKLPKFLEKMKLVLDDPRSVILTDKELLTAVNQKLKVKDRISLSCWEFWKTSNLNSRSPENTIDDKEIVQEFRQLLEYARVEQKMNLTGNILDENNKNQWGATWILERKFDDLKLKQGIELNHNPIINITAGSETDKKMLESILSGKTIDIQHEEVREDPELLNE